MIFPVFSVLAMELEGSTPMLVGLAMGCYGLTSAFLQIPFGTWSDRAGRKPVLAVAIIIFILGSIMAAMSSNIYTMILARFLQGAGAVSAPIFALIADLTRPEVRARANAGLGASIGMAFGVAMFAAPFLAHWLGLSGVFWAITGMASMSLVILFTFIPSPKVVVPLTKEKTSVLIRRVLDITPLKTINLGAFVCSMGLSITFFMTPLLLKENGWDKSDWWKVYLPMLLAGAMTMVPAAIIAETKNKFREVMIVGAILILATFVILFLGQALNSFALNLTAGFLFFMGFNIFEPIFPSLVTRMTDPQTKGTASGVYNFCQFIGQFLGAMLAGMLYLEYPSTIALVMIVLTLFFIWKTLSFPNPTPREEKEQTDATPTNKQEGVYN